jgi:hypothetical protein
VQLGVADQALLAGLGAREEQVAALAKPQVDAEVLREAAALVDALHHQAHVAGVAPLHAHAAAVAARRAAHEVAALDHRDRQLGGAREVVGEREAHDAGADDRHVDVRGERRARAAHRWRLIRPPARRPGWRR